MGQFKPMVKMMTTEPTVELKLKKGGSVAMKKGGSTTKAKKMAMGGGALSDLAGTPAFVGRPAINAPVATPGRPSMAMRRKAMAPKPAMGGAPAPVMGGAPMGGMKKGGRMKEGGDMDMAQDKAMIKKAFKQHDMQEHKGAKGTTLKLKKGGMKKYATGGSIPSESSSGNYDTTKVYSARPDNSPAKTGEVKEGNAGGYKRGGRMKKMATGGVAKANGGGYATGGAIPSEESYGDYDTTKVYQARPDSAHGTGGVKNGNGGGFKRGGATKKHFATGGSVNDAGSAVAMPQGSKLAPTPVMIAQLSGTYRKGGKVTRPEAALLKANDQENSASMKAAKKYSVDPDPMILPASRMKRGGRTC
jgi:hypothetical protein